MSIREGSYLIVETLMGAMFGPFDRGDAQDKFDELTETHPWAMLVLVRVEESSRVGVHVPPFRAEGLDRIPHGIRDPAQALQHAARSD